MTNAGGPAIEGVDLDGIREYLARTELQFALLFGSHGRGAASESSDLDIALRFPEDMDERERFDRRNRIDAELQRYSEKFVDVSDIETLPIPVACAALQDGIPLTGDEEEIERFRERVEDEYETDARERKQEREDFIDRLARGDT